MNSTVTDVVLFLLPDSIMLVQPLPLVDWNMNT
ncbi:hypothetical protein L195_g043835, partial [Trifolium pratense]